MDHSRRQALKFFSGVTASLASPKIVRAQGEFSNEPSGESVTLGFISPQTGPLARDGGQAIQGFSLAVDHLNHGGGMLETFSSKALDGRGVLGRKIDWVSQDDLGRPENARYAGRNLVDSYGATALFGSITTSTAAAVQDICTELQIAYFPGAIHGQRFTDDLAFRFSATGGSLTRAIMEYAALRSYGKPRVVTIATDSPDSQYLADVAEAEAIVLGWDQPSRYEFPMGRNYSSYDISMVYDEEPEVVVVCGQGLDLLKQLQTIQDNNSSIGKIIMIPFLDVSALEWMGVGPNTIIGALDWYPSLDVSGAQVFVRDFESENSGLLPTDIAHAAYCQTVLYADAVERARSFNPHAVREALEGFEFSGLGFGAAYMSPNSHELRKDLYIGSATGQGNRELPNINVYDDCVFCGTNSPESCSQNACRQGYCCEDGVCRKAPCRS